ncbi:hypothetical protein AB0D08_24140 [Kitasatospora sp. NPDC048540]|uniref:hypothetical protein n=1 Tax=unclassified Kitasatospora TaxID=2633591 RepID=UPI00053B3572|nr:hypothetical protein [Kitasatospora sp. MBT63]
MNTWATWTTQGILAGHGGVRTVEIGVIKGDLTVHTMWIEGKARLTVQYSGALDWFTVAGSPVAAPDEATARELHQRLVEAVKADSEAVAPQAAA